ncbi:hypothetical protein B0T24DRAFT_651726 [Lasiosphaeria ovina]|uniref:Uncharacterized protein n=1 Tax=Lasiosphaeria ovina TaxID=92902 RepID=A0AAE0MZS6_9PEZI|nr:hypothetical protein B0T24DRAFT_651726 [Lasiosphaeria ovina]
MSSYTRLFPFLLVTEVKGIYIGLVLVEIILHRTLLYEYYDFFLASRLVSKYAILARIWRYTSLEYILSFIYLAYSIIALLYETVPAFKDIWIKCLGDLGRYRIAIKDKDIRDREVWISAPITGRLYYYLAILARPNTL